MKKIKNTTLASLLLIYLFTNCSENKEQNALTFDKFPTEINLSHEKITTPPNLYCVGGLLLLDSILISVDLNADTFFQVFKLPLFEYKGGFVLRGSGPDEENFINPFLCRSSNNEFLFKTEYNVKIAKYDEQTNHFAIVKQIDLPSKISAMWNLIKLGDSLIGNRVDRQSNQEFVGYNLKNKEVFDFGDDFPLVEKDIPLHLKDLLFGKVSIQKPDGTAFATVYDKFPILRIYSRTGHLTKEIRLNNGQSFPQTLIEDVPSPSELNEVVQNYRAIRASNNFIYALYIGKPSKELEPGINDFSNEIHVWNWDGDPIKRILLDENIFTFEVDLEDHYIIASSMLSLDALYKYNLR